jgi:tetratricopeptide (TPR) repeat protein
MKDTPIELAQNDAVSEPDAISQRKGLEASHPALLAGSLILLTFLAYLPALHCGFIWDDNLYVTQNPMLTDAHGLHEIWFSAHTQSQYFPLVYTTFRLEHALWGLNPFGYHLINILLHGLNAALVWMVLRRLQVPAAWLAAAIFALHPVEVESVAWVSELKNVESLFFYLLSLLTWMKFTEPAGRSPGHYYALALACFLLALFAKTTACTLPAAMVLVLWLRDRHVSAVHAAQMLPFLIIGVAMGAVSLWWEKHLGDYAQSFGLAFTFAERLLIAARALWFYAGKLAWPVPLSIIYPQWNINSTHPAQYLPVAGCVALAIALWIWRGKIGRGVIAGVIFFVAALSPLLGFIVEGSFHYTYVADHYQYTASIGLIAVFAALVWRCLAHRPAWPAFQAALLLMLGAATWARCAPYHDLESLWRDTLAKNPGSWMAHHNLGVVLFEQGRVDDALTQYEQAVALYPNGDAEQSDLGTALLEKRNYPEAIQHLKAALAINPNLFQALNSLGLAYDKTGDDAHAMACYRQALQLDPRALGTFLNLGNVLERQGKAEEAASVYRTAMERFPDQAEPFRRLAAIQSHAGQYSLAIQTCQQGLLSAPDSEALWLSLGNAYLAQTNNAGAAASYEKALQIDPASAGLHYNLALALESLGQIESARQELRYTLQLDPNFTPAGQELLSLKPQK